LHIAKYKVRDSKITVNGGEAVALTKNSDDGEYDVITVDTSEIKTVTVSTASGGWRAMVNTVVWYRLEETVSASQGLAYTLNSDGESYSVTGIGTCTDTDLIIPETYEGKPVTEIASHAFDECWRLESISIPSSVVVIGDHAFSSCYSVESIKISNSVTNIGRYAFWHCSNVSDVVIPSSVTEISWAFINCSNLTSVIIENKEGAVKIHNDAFKDTNAKITYVGKPKDGAMRIMVEVPTLLALLDGKATEKEVQAICQQVKTLGEDAENLEKRLKKCIK
jgi:hypothetical protein